MELANNSYSKENAVESLQKLINSWLNENPNRNVASLAKSANVGENCIRRVLNSKSMPTTENLLKITTFIKGISSHNQLLSKLDTDLKNQLMYELPFLSFEELTNYVNMSSYEEHLSDYTSQFIFERSSMGSGIELAEVKDLFGQIGIEKVTILIELNLVTMTNNKIIVNDFFKYHTWSTSLYKKFIPETIKNFYKCESQVNYLFNVNEGLTVKGYAQVMDVLENAYKQIQNIVNTEKGEIPVSIAGFMDTMSKKDHFTKENEA